ncbi:MAG: hypothetical protein B7Y41_14210 [Hydrogenophilales bacterium 28-61-23]|nr:MAG: hypothetical protein B7Y41_14210 [Hydrogenophilales bacterium 28-61-23]
MNMALLPPQQQTSAEALKSQPITQEFGPTVMPETLLYCHPTRLANIYQPSIERVFLPSASIEPDQAKVSIQKSMTPAYTDMANCGLGGRLRTTRERFSRRPRRELGERLIYDARRSYNNNIAHLIHEHMVLLGYVRQKLGFDHNDIIVILDNNAPLLSTDFFREINYETYLTNLEVSGNLLSIDIEETRYLLPYVANIPLTGFIDSTPEKIFISRSGTRRLLNEPRVASMLAEHGYERFFFEQLSLREQWSITRNASSIVAIHGAALGMLAFQAFNNRSAKAHVVELFTPGLVADVFRKYMAILGGSWSGCRGKPTPELIKDLESETKFKRHAFSDFELDPKVIELAITAQ